MREMRMVLDQVGQTFDVTPTRLAFRWKRGCYLDRLLPKGMHSGELVDDGLVIAFHLFVCGWFESVRNSQPLDEGFDLVCA